VSAIPVASLSAHLCGRYLLCRFMWSITFVGHGGFSFLAARAGDRPARGTAFRPTCRDGTVRRPQAPGRRPRSWRDLRARFYRRPPRRRSNVMVRAERGRGLVIARARPESVRLTETYFYDRVIARHHMTERKRAPTGQIRIVVPYDGERYFGRQAYRDVRTQLGATAPSRAQALIGHLTLVDDGRTDLASVLDLSGSHGSVPLTVPVTLGDIEYPGVASRRPAHLPHRARLPARGPARRPHPGRDAAPGRGGWHAHR
jgi:hypothetical protein